ncbi:MAG: GNAT family N-acetyltransferase, partial [Betaproteobacteria bacterium]|nr:GNAT family N-acetyltransferase [Betaproteobacteria bacterium]
MSAPTWMLDRANHDDIPQLVTLLELLFAIEQDFSADPERQRAGLQGVIDSPLGHIAVARDAAGKAIAMCSAQL